MMEITINPAQAQRSEAIWTKTTGPGKRRMIPEKPNKHELKTRETRELLLRAAEQVFVRDGYEGAELGEIAALAGRTKGAIYAQFKSKEEVFLALIEEQTARKAEAMRSIMTEPHSIEENKQAMREYLAEQCNDRTFALLLLEFKLYTLRHPESGEQLKDMMRRMFTPEREPFHVALLGEDSNTEMTLKRHVALKVIQPIFSAVTLEAALFPDVIELEDMQKIMLRVFDALI